MSVMVGVEVYVGVTDWVIVSVLVAVTSSLINLARRFLACPPIEVKYPPNTIFPSGCTKSESTNEFALGSKAISNVPSEFRQAIWFLLCPPIWENSPPASILPSLCTTMASTL